MASIRIVALAVISGLAISALTAWFCLRQEAPSATAPNSPGPALGASSPAAGEADAALESLNAAPPLPAKVFHLSFDAEGKPVPDDSLRAAFDYYLLEIGGDKGLRELAGMAVAHSSAAETQALSELAEHYLLYMRKSDTALAATGLVPEALRDVRGVEACAGWLNQREQLQREALGEGFASAMFGNDNLLFNDALAHLRASPQGKGEDAEEPSGIRHPAHAAPPSNEDEASAIRALVPALRSFADQAASLRAWRKRYDDMLAALGRKNLDARTIGKPDSKANALLREYFSVEEDRRRTMAELSRE